VYFESRRPTLILVQQIDGKRSYDDDELGVNFYDLGVETFSRVWSIVGTYYISVSGCLMAVCGLNDLLPWPP
jgi:hypothetical protein